MARRAGVDDRFLENLRGFALAMARGKNNPEDSEGDECNYGENQPERAKDNDSLISGAFFEVGDGLLDLDDADFGRVLPDEGLLA